MERKANKLYTKQQNMNYGVFSKHLLARFNWLTKQTDKNRDVFNKGPLQEIVKYDDELDNGVFMCSLYPEDQIAKSIQQKLWYDPNIQTVQKWVVFNIIRNITKDSHNTICVKIRIATSMLNALVMMRNLTIDENIRMHDNMVKNLLELKKDSMNEDLPF